MTGVHRREPENEGADTPKGKRLFKPAGKSGLIADRKGRRVLVQRTGSEEARSRNELEANGYGPPGRPQRGDHGKRDSKPQQRQRLVSCGLDISTGLCFSVSPWC